MQEIFNPVGQKVFPECLKGVIGLEEGEGEEWPPSLSPDEGEVMQVHQKTFASNQTPFSVVWVPFSTVISVMPLVPFLEIIIMLVFIMKQVPVHPAALLARGPR